MSNSTNNKTETDQPTVDASPTDALSEADIEVGYQLKKVFSLFRQYEIPLYADKDQKEAIDWTVRLFFLVIAMAKTHPKHRDRKRSGAKRVWGDLQRAALVSEVSLLKSQWKKSGEKYSAKAACKIIATRPHWRSFLKKADDPAETLRQTYSKAKADKTLESFSLFYTEGRAKGEDNYLKRIRFGLGIDVVRLNARDHAKRLDQLLHK
jgi:hypothetical protein